MAIKQFLKGFHLVLFVRVQQIIRKTGLNRVIFLQKKISMVLEK